MKKNVAIDVDGVLASYSGWKGFDHIGEPLEGAKEFLVELRKTYRVVIFTTRGNVERNWDNVPMLAYPQSLAIPEAVARVKMYLRDKIAEWLEKHDLPYDEIYTGQGKPICAAIVDDRAVNCQPQFFPNAFADALRQIAQLDRMYYKKQKKESSSG